MFVLGYWWFTVAFWPVFKLCFSNSILTTFNTTVKAIYGRFKIFDLNNLLYDIFMVEVLLLFLFLARVGL